MVPRDLDAHQLLQVHVIGYGRCLIHICRVVDGGDAEFGTPVPLLVSFTEDFVSNALDVGDGLELDYALS